MINIDLKNIDIPHLKSEILKGFPDSQSNGSLMRITPLAIWAHKLEEQDLDKVVREEVTLTHLNEIPQEAAVCYCLCIKYLIFSGGNARYAWYKTRYLFNKLNQIRGYAQVKNYTEIFEWLNISVNPKGTILTNCEENIGWVKHAFVWSMHFLYHQYQYEDAISKFIIFSKK